MATTDGTDDDRIPLRLVHGAWLLAGSWENFTDYFEGRSFAVSAPESPRTHLLMAAEGWDEVAASIDRWLDVLDATATATATA